MTNIEIKTQPGVDISDFLTSPEPDKAAYARGMMSGIPVAVKEWMTSEIERDTSVADALFALAQLQITLYANFAAAVIEPAGDDLLQAGYISLANQIKKSLSDVRSLQKQLDDAARAASGAGVPPQPAPAPTRSSAGEKLDG